MISRDRGTLRWLPREFWRWFGNQHSDFIDPFQFIDLLRSARAANLRPFDIMLEAKAKELALLRLREQIAKFAPDLAGVVI